MEVFAAYVGQVLGPELEEGDEVIMDNLCIHKTPLINRLIEARGSQGALIDFATLAVAIKLISLAETRAAALSAALPSP